MLKALICFYKNTYERNVKIKQSKDIRGWKHHKPLVFKTSTGKRTKAPLKIDVWDTINTTAPFSTSPNPHIKRCKVTSYSECHLPANSMRRQPHETQSLKKVRGATGHGVRKHRKEPVGAPANAAGQPEPRGAAARGSPSPTARQHRGLRKWRPGLLSLVAQPALQDRAPQSQLSRTATLRLTEEKVKIKLGNRNRAKKPQKSCSRIFNSTRKQQQGELMEREKPSANCSAKPGDIQMSSGKASRSSLTKSL